MRCLPAYAQTSEAADGTGYYMDAGCTVPAALTLVFTAYPSCQPLAAPKYVAGVNTATCSLAQGPSIYLASAPQSSAYFKSGTAMPVTCTLENLNQPGASFTYLFTSASGAEIPPGSFAEITSATTTSP